MKRAIVQPADVTGAALDELKQWLGITRIDEDGQLAGLLKTSLEICEAFTGQVPIETGFEEIHAGTNGWTRLSTCPVRAITAVETVDAGGLRLPLAVSSYEVELAADGSGLFRLLQPASEAKIAITFVAGIAADWASAPDAIKHGIIRLAAHHYLGRDNGDTSGPPASVAALWRPWKQVRLA